MDTILLVLLFLAIIIVIGSVLYLLVKKPQWLKKQWRILVGASSGVVGTLGIAWLLSLLFRNRSSSSRGDSEMKEKEDEFRKELDLSRKEVEEELEEARGEEREVKEELEEISEIEDESTRLQRLADLWNKRRGR